MTKVIVKLESNLGQNVMCIGKFEAEGSVHIVGAVPSLSAAAGAGGGAGGAGGEQRAPSLT